MRWRRMVTSELPKPFTTCPNPASSFPTAVILYVPILPFTFWPAMPDSPREIWYRSTIIEKEMAKLQF